MVMLAEGQPNLIQLLMSMPLEERVAALQDIPNEIVAALLYDWPLWARPKQLAPPGNWQVWLNMSGRGYGKTRTGAEWITEKAKTCRTGKMFLLGATTGDVRDTMIEGESGILAISRPDFRPRYSPSRRRVEWPNGCVAKTFSGEEPERLRGPQHEYGWIDELGAFQYPQEAWDQSMLGLRLGLNPQTIVTTTPKPIPLLVKLLEDAVPCWELRGAQPGDEILQRKIGTVVTTGSSYENRENLSESWYNRTIKPYEGTRLGDQEILAKLLTDVPGALWKMAMIEATRLRLLDDGTRPALPPFTRAIVAVDPAITMAKNSNETGIIMAAKAANGHGYILTDRSGKHSPDQWARIVVQLYYEHKLDRVVAEQNQGGEMVRSTIHTVDSSVPVKLVTATRGKVVRAEPVAALYEQSKIHHVGTFGALEAQLTTWVPDSGLDSPDRMDALVWAVTDLLLAKQGAFIV